jgi:hypothetical protein
MCPSDVESLRFRIIYNGLIVLFGGAKSFCELCRGDEAPEIWAGGIINFREEVVEFGLVSKR